MHIKKSFQPPRQNRRRYLGATRNGNFQTQMAWCGQCVGGVGIQPERSSVTLLPIEKRGHPAHEPNSKQSGSSPFRIEILHNKHVYDDL